MFAAGPHSGTDHRRRGRRVAPVAGAALAALVGLSVAGSATPVAAAGPARSGAVGGYALRDARAAGTARTSAPSDRACEADFGVKECYTPAEVRRIYGVSGLLRRGDTGKGETIVIIDSYGSPTIAADLAHFDAAYHLAAPPSLRVLSPLGTVPYVNNAQQSGWAGETSLDVEWAHAMAPGANLVLMTSPVDETEGTAGLGDFLKLEQYALNHHLGQVISQSWAATENTLETPAGRRLVRAFERFYERAARRHVTVFGSTGDGGSQNPSNAASTRYYHQPTVNFPASSPYVTAVGGTAVEGAGGRWRSETVWNDGRDGGAGGGGISQLFAEPSWQRSLPASVQTELGGHRGLPDVSWNASPNTGIEIYQSFGRAGTAGFALVGGTSEGSPQWAGYIADIDQARGSAIGDLNPILYRLGAAAFHDITVGTNAHGGVPGYSATPGWDAASGLGTPRGAVLTGDLERARRTT